MQSDPDAKECKRLNTVRKLYIAHFSHECVQSGEARKRKKAEGI